MAIPVSSGRICEECAAIAGARPAGEAELPRRVQPPDEIGKAGRCGKAAKKIAVLALGNLMHADDGVGIHALQRMEVDDQELVARCRESNAALQWIEGGTLGLELTHALSDVDCLLVLDAVEMDLAPGTVARYAGESLYRLPAGRSVHLMGLSDLLTAIRLLGNEPGDIVLLGVQPASTEWGLELSTEVAAALPLLMRAAENQIVSWMEPAKDDGCRKDCVQGCCSASAG